MKVFCFEENSSNGQCQWLQNPNCLVQAAVNCTERLYDGIAGLCTSRKCQAGEISPGSDWKFFGDFAEIEVAEAANEEFRSLTSNQTHLGDFSASQAGPIIIGLTSFLVAVVLLLLFVGAIVVFK